MADTQTYTWFITGYARPLPRPAPVSLTRTACSSANRGIGLELARQLLAAPAHTVLAACRNPARADALHALARSDAGKGRLHVLPLEITDRESVRDAAQAVGEIVGERGLDYLVNNAAIVCLSTTLVLPSRARD